MARNKIPDSAEEKRRRKFKGGELFGLVLRSLTGSWIFCNKIGFSKLQQINSVSHRVARILQKSVA
jgi:hypothetical protein